MWPGEYLQIHFKKNNYDALSLTSKLSKTTLSAPWKSSKGLQSKNQLYLNKLLDNKSENLWCVGLMMLMLPPPHTHRLVDAHGGARCKNCGCTVMADEVHVIWRGA